MSSDTEKRTQISNAVLKNTNKYMSKKEELDLILDLFENSELYEIIRKISAVKICKQGNKVKDIILLLKAYSYFKEGQFISFEEQDLKEIVNGLKLISKRCEIRKFPTLRLGGRENKSSAYVNELSRHIPFSLTWNKIVTEISENVSERSIYRILEKYLEPANMRIRPVKLSEIFTTK